MSGRSTFIALALALAPLAARGDPDDTDFVYINGGASVLSNYAWHEFDIEHFRMSLFKGRGEVFNAGGEKTTVLESTPEGQLVRDAEGFVIPTPSPFQGARPEAATLNNVEAHFAQMQKKAPKRVTAVFGDHGGPDGICLWGGDRLNAQRLHSDFSRFADTTLVRSIHLHCFGGAAIVDPKREVPASSEALKGFLAQHYRRNICALAMGSEDEVAQYYAYRPWPQGPWYKVLHQAAPSLRGLKKHFAENESLFPTPRLSSDYLLEDLRKHLCFGEKPELEVVEERAPTSGHVSMKTATITRVSELGRKIDPALKESICNEKERSTLAKDTEDELAAAKAEDDFEIGQDKLKHAFLKRNFARTTAAGRAALNRVDELKRDFAARGRGMPQLIRDDIKAFEEGPIHDLNRIYLGLHYNPAYQEAFVNDPAQHALEKAKALKCRCDLQSIGVALQQVTIAAARKRKQDTLKVEEGRHAALEKWIQSEAPASIKELYDGIVACENSTLN